MVQQRQTTSHAETNSNEYFKNYVVSFCCWRLFTIFFPLNQSRGARNLRCVTPYIADTSFIADKNIS